MLLREFVMYVQINSNIEIKSLDANETLVFEKMYLGLSIKEIAQKLRLPQDYVNNLVNRIKSKGWDAMHLKEEEIKVIELYKKNMQYKEISDITGLTIGQVQYIIKKYRKVQNKEKIVQKLYTQGKTEKEISKLVCLPENQVRWFLIGYKTDTKTNVEVVTEKQSTTKDAIEKLCEETIAKSNDVKEQHNTVAPVTINVSNVEMYGAEKRNVYDDAICTSMVVETDTNDSEVAEFDKLSEEDLGAIELQCNSKKLLDITQILLPNCESVLTKLHTEVYVLEERLKVVKDCIEQLTEYQKGTLQVQNVVDKLIETYQK